MEAQNSTSKIFWPCNTNSGMDFLHQTPRPTSTATNIIITIAPFDFPVLRLSLAVFLDLITPSTLDGRRRDQEWMTIDVE